MKRAIVFAALITLFMAGVATAAVWTDTAEFDAQALIPAMSPPLRFSSLDSSAADQNQLFTNNTSAFGLGSGVNTVGAVVITSATYGTLTGNKTANGILSPTGNLYVAIYGVQGSVVALPQVGIPANASFTKGTLQIVEIANDGSFVASDPTTWGFGNTPVATYTLSAPTTVLPGATPVNSTAGAISTNPNAWPQQVLYTQEQMNIGALNTQVQAEAQGLFLFDKTPGSDLLVSDSGQILPGPTPYLEGLLVKTEQAVIDTTGLPLTAAMQDTLNQIGDWAFGADFATFGSGDAGDYTPVVVGGQATTFGPGGSLDFAAQLGMSAMPTLTTPEPFSVIVWAGLGCVGLIFWSIRRNRQ
jgi:hypothetical protein